MHTALSVMFFVSVSAFAQTGAIDGIVVNEADVPIAGAEVHIAENKPFVGHQMIQTYETDSEGKFLIPDVPWGSYVIMAGKQEAGYPDTKLAFYSKLVAPKAALGPESPTVAVKVQLGPKAGILEIQSLVDQDTGTKIESAKVTLRRVRSPNLFIAVSVVGGARIPVPSLADVGIEVSAAGYKTWPSQQIDGAAAKINLKPEEIYKVQIRLARESTAKEY
jgi:hypothetical protein